MPEVEEAVAALPPSWFGKLTLSVNNNSTKATGTFADPFYAFASHKKIREKSKTPRKARGLLLPHKGSNLDIQIQNLPYYHYTMGQCNDFR